MKKFVNDPKQFVPEMLKGIALANPGKVPLELVEVQCGAYLGEDDIVRFEDVYGRAEGKSD